MAGFRDGPESLLWRTNSQFTAVPANRTVDSNVPDCGNPPIESLKLKVVERFVQRQGGVDEPCVNIG
jgi:hypothetical protein